VDVSLTGAGTFAALASSAVKSAACLGWSESTPGSSGCTGRPAGSDTVGSDNAGRAESPGSCCSCLLS
jgi:hypothetical protein